MFGGGVNTVAALIRVNTVCAFLSYHVTGCLSGALVKHVCSKSKCTYITSEFFFVNKTHIDIAGSVVYLHLQLLKYFDAFLLREAFLQLDRFYLVSFACLCIHTVPLDIRPIRSAFNLLLN